MHVSVVNYNEEKFFIFEIYWLHRTFGAHTCIQELQKLMCKFEVFPFSIAVISVTFKLGQK